jgi:uncharacterized protein YerC
VNGVIDQLDNAFWPRNREEIFNFIKDIPTLEELDAFGV